MKIERNLKKGMEGDDVKRLQEELKKAEHDPGPVDGKFGEKTEEAVKKFQKEKGLKEDGTVGPKTAKALNDAVEGRPPAAVSPAVDVSAQKALLDIIEKINEMLKKLEEKLDEKQKEKFEKLEKRKADLLLKKLEKDLDELEKQMAAWQRNNTGTREGTTAEAPELNPRTAYNFITDEDKFVALPCKGLKGKWLEIVLPDGTRATAPVGDVGPHHTDDCYWERGDRPKAESEGGNKAGIDISQQLWVQMGLDPKAGSIQVDWRFVEPPADGQVEINKSDGIKIKHKNKGE